MAASALINLSPAVWLLLTGALVALGPVAWVGWRGARRVGSPALRPHHWLQALTVLTLFLTFDLVVFGAFTRLTDSGLGCPDWPGCYGHASPLGAHADIHAAQTQMPTGPVTFSKAWIEMVHRYLATGVGALILVLLTGHLALQRRWRALPRHPLPGVRPALATLVLVWVCAQGAFGALTVTLKLYPAIVTAHLLGGIGLLALLAVQARWFSPARARLSAGLRAWVWLLLAAVVCQVALGGWVSTNYAVLACTDAPTCQGQWWPPADFAEGFTLRRALGRTGAGDFLPFEALTAIHLAHRCAAVVVALLSAGVAAALLRAARQAGADAVLLRRAALGLAAWLVWQLASGLSNAVLGWPMLAALAHTAGAAAIVAGLAAFLVTTAPPGAFLSTPERIRHDALAQAVPPA